MTTTAATSDIRPLPLVALQLSQTPAQKERRAHFDKAKLNELAESLKSVGLLQPIVVRPSPFREVDENLFEVVAGERRVAASKLAGLEEILASVRELDDHQVAKIQLIENLQREDVHPLAEAEGYDELLKLHGYSAEQLAAEVGKSKAYVYARLKLLALDPASREAFYRGELNASTALLIARIPVASLQRKACGEITKPRHGWGGSSEPEPMSYREALDHIQDTYMLRLEDAPFPTDRADLVRNVGACGACPKRAGNQPQLFEDVKGADVCTDPTCFKSKREAWGKRQLSDAKAKGQTIIAGASAKKVKPYDHSDSLQGGYVHLDTKCWDDPKKRTYRQLIAGTDITPSLLQVPKTGEVIEIVQEKAAIKAAGVKRPTPKGPSNTVSAADKAERGKREVEKAFRLRLLAEIRGKAPKQLSREDLEGIALSLFNSGYGDDEEVFDVLGLAEPGGTAHDRHQRALVSHIKSVTPIELNGVVLTMMLRGDLEYQLDKKSEPLLATAKRLKIDPEKVRKELAAAEKAKEPALAKASKKKSRK